MTSDESPTPDLPADRRKGYRSHTPAERAEYGKAARKRTPRSALAHFSPGPDRPDPISLLVEQGESRVEALLPIRYGRMAVSPFTFFRGAALPMAADLASLPNSGLKVQLCGDAHLLNFGVYGTPERRMVFDMNDFDETSVGPFEWDVMRLASSIVLASRERGDSPEKTEKYVMAASKSYRDSMAKFSRMGTLDVWYSFFDVERFVRGLDKQRRGKAAINESNLDKIRRRDSLFAAEKTTTIVDGVPQFVSNPPLQIRGVELGPLGFPAFNAQLSVIIDTLYTPSGQYRMSLSPERRHLFDEYRVIDFALRVVGVGSVGTRCFILLLVGRDFDDPLILQVKEATSSVLERFAGRSTFKSHGERVVAGQKLTQSASDLFLGWADNTDPQGTRRSFYLRQFRDWKFSVEFDQLDDVGFEFYVKLCGWAIAKAHARSGDQIAISSYVGQGKAFDSAMTSFAHDYADQSVRDHDALVAAIDSGRIDARLGV